MTVSQEDILYSKLNTLEIPTLGESLENHIQDIIEWIEIGHLTAFEIEQRMKQDDMDIQTLGPLELKMKEIEKLIENCIEQTEQSHKTIKLQSEWSSLKHFIKSLNQSIHELNIKREIRSWMESALIGIDSLSWMIFNFYEKRQQHLPFENLLVDIDQQVALLFQEVERCYERMMTGKIEDDDLVRKHVLIQARWESLRLEIDELKMELKEDRWLVVFGQVSDQVEAMMNALENADSYSWDTKYRHYTPSIDKMLAMLGNGIAARVSKDSVTLARHEALIRRWDKLRATMDFHHRSISPAGSEPLMATTSWRGSPVDRGILRYSPSLRSSPIERSVSESRGREERKLQKRTSKSQLGSSPIERSVSDSRRYEQEETKIQKRASRSQLRSPTVMTMRRAATPSFIPRPKTPHTEIPARPHSSMTRKSTSLYTK
ncbi:hypothetical protein G6F46_004341 [Rhizopus delemar]|nr:hypothetical protein G6F55_001202 [Rhizopus delemar]KAG1548776.1 hypothetical protein G6F51_003465 [Rhizopus arrhizus]KAG1500658.1 hypothetical protein G6F54_003566 [Rhizopus delemar]KAG1510609.1 hypothetical protein G6F53_006555 [Rhizopus delemar]KAG1525992.1 hypothetical protein G6F52_002829 [Rhizopus delemar]